MPLVHIEIYLRSRLSRVAFIAVVGATALALAAEALKVGGAATMAQSDDLTTLHRASQLDPSNAAIQERIGQSYNLDQGNPSEAVHYLRRAVKLNPKQARFWPELGWACLALGDQRCADEAFERSVQLAPMVPRIQREFVNYCLVGGHKSAAVMQLARSVQTDPEHASDVVALYLRAYGDDQSLWDELAKQRGSGAQVRYIELLTQQDRADQAAKYWNQLVSSKSALPLEETKLYLETLLNLSRYSDAAQVWRDLQHRGLVQHDPANLVFNGSFEQQPALPGFDWQVEPLPYVHAARAASDDGRKALEVEYTVPDNSESTAATELVPLAPNQTYTLSAYARSEELTSDSGPRLRITDPKCPTCLDVTTQTTTGTTSWHPVIVTFAAPPTTTVVRLSIWRQRSRSFPTKITGRFWLRSVLLRPSSSEELVRSKAPE